MSKTIPNFSEPSITNQENLTDLLQLQNLLYSESVDFFNQSFELDDFQDMDPETIFEL